MTRKKSRVSQRRKGYSRAKKAKCNDETKDHCPIESILLEYPDNTICLDLGGPDIEMDDLLLEMQKDDTVCSPVLQANSPLLPDEHFDSDSRFWEIPDLQLITNEHIPRFTAELVDSDGSPGDEFYVILDRVYQYDASVNLDDFFGEVKYSLLRKKCMNMTFSSFTMLPSRFIRFIDFYDNRSHASIKTCITVDQEFNASIVVHDLMLPKQHMIWDNMPGQFFTIDTKEKLLKKVADYKVCQGNPDPKFQERLSPNFYKDVPSEDCAGFLESNKYYEDINYTGTIRSSKCSLLTLSERCKSCQLYRRTLSKRHARLKAKIPTPEKNWLSSHKGNSLLSETQKLAKLKQMTSLSTGLKIRVKSLEEKTKKIIEENGITLQEKDNNDLSSLMSSLSAQVENDFPDSSAYQRVFREQQLKFNRLKDKRGMRWHPLMIKWCIYLRSKSSSTYDSLKNSGFIKLPSRRLLYDYSHYVKAGVGYCPEVFEALKEEIKQKQLTENWQKYVGILQDEIKIKEDLVYDKPSGELIGFVNLDSIGNAINNMEECIKEETPKLAKSVLVVMVRGIASNLKFPLAHFATSGITSDQLFPILWKAVELLEIDVGLKVLFITSDGASPNRRFIKLHDTGNKQGIVYRAENRFSEDDRFIYFISDPPHLVKTARNCMANSYSHKNTRKLWNNKDISWLHIVDLFKDHCSAGLRLCPKLSRNHIDISSYACMKVSYAAQVLSSTVANALELVYGPEVSESVTFIRHMNKFFDCLNTRNLYEARNTRNENLAPYTTPDDPRLDYLLNDFLDYFQQWKTNVDNRRGQFSKSQKASMQLSYQTLQGLEITVKSIVECVKVMLAEGAPFVLTEHFNQDPIEQHFGAIRTGGGCNNNPTLQQFNFAIGKVRVAGSQALAPVRGNTKRNLNRDFMQEVCQPLPKKKRN